MDHLRKLLTAALLLCAAFSAYAAAPADSLPDGDKQCLGCHSTEGMTKKAANGDSIPLHVDGDAFARSVHKMIGCQSCHAQAKLPEHPGNAKEVKGAKAFTVAQSESCRNCHDRVFQTYEGSMHATRLREGNSAAPSCADCHRPHAVTAASVQDGPKNACATCHGNPADIHQKWLPNAATHLKSIACSACHAPDALRKIDLRLFDAKRQERLVDRNVLFEKRARAADRNGDGLDALELRELVAQFNGEGVKVALHGHVELRNGIEAHELPVKARALRECTACHREGMAQFQRVSVSAIDADGRPLRYDAQPDVLNSPLSVDALRGFYAIGGTRIKLLDALLALALVAGISVPAIHIALRKLLERRDRKDGEQQ